VDDDLDLETVMTGLSMSQMALRHMGEVALAGRDECGKVGAETPGTWSGARAGTSSVLYGQAETVNSQEEERRRIPSLVSAHSGSGSTKKFKLFEVLQMEMNFEEICFRLIGQGTMFCMARNCTTTHQGTTLNPLPAALFVAKTAAKAFADPISLVTSLSGPVGIME
jgi:hypothetical protein